MLCCSRSFLNGPRVMQAKIINDAVIEYGISKRNVKYIVADNAALNSATVDILNEKYGFVVKFVRCLPHCLNLYIVAFLKPFEVKFGMTSFLKLIRRFIKAGGGSSRRAALLEWGLSLSQIDFSDTRWEAVVKAIMYMMELQTDRELKNARTQLQNIFDETGDQSAADALEEDDVAQTHWRVVYEVIEDLATKVDTSNGM